MLKPRSALRALLLSLLLPGLGQLYNGELNKAIWLFLLTAVAVTPLIAALALYAPLAWLPFALIGGIAVIALLWLYAVLDTVLTARRRQDYQLQAWQRSGIYLAVWLLCSLLILPSVGAWVRNHWAESFLVPSQSMQPTLLPNDFIFADKRYNRTGGQAIQRGDIAIFIYPNDRSVYFIKRVIGLPGDKIKIQGADVSVNGKSLRLATTSVDSGLLVTETTGQSRWQVFWNNKQQQLPQTQLTVPAGEVFVLGDNRTDSNDSRFYGSIPLRDVLGKAHAIWLSVKGNDLRWERMGTSLH